jgi:hypothetical protein
LFPQHYPQHSCLFKYVGQWIAGHIIDSQVLILIKKVGKKPVLKMDNQGAAGDLPMAGGEKYGTLKAGCWGKCWGKC